MRAVEDMSIADVMHLETQADQFRKLSDFEKVIKNAQQELSYCRDGMGEDDVSRVAASNAIDELEESIDTFIASIRMSLLHFG